jgi:hypothetical protein
MEILLANLNMPYSRLISSDTEMYMNRGLRSVNHEKLAMELRIFPQLISFASSFKAEMPKIDSKRKGLTLF